MARHLFFLVATKVTDAGLIFCRDTPRPLKKLAIEKSEITDAGLATIGQLKSLEDLNLFRCNKITDDGIKSLSALVDLERLFLNNNDRLTSACLQHLTQLKKLTRLEIDGMAVPAESINRLQAQLPKCKIVNSIKPAQEPKQRRRQPKQRRKPKAPGQEQFART